MIMTTTTTGGDPGIGVVIALVTLLGAAILAYRRDANHPETTDSIDIDEILEQIDEDDLLDDDEVESMIAEEREGVNEERSA